MIGLGGTPGRISVPARTLLLTVAILGVSYLWLAPTATTEANLTGPTRLASDDEYGGLGSFASTMQVRSSMVLTTSTQPLNSSTPADESGESTTTSEPPAGPDEAENLALITENPTRNTMFDDNSFRDVPMSQINVGDLTVDGDLFSEVLLDTSNSAYFRITCEVSHFAYDDPIVHPDQPGRAHLHMFFGNTEANAYSDYNSLLDTGTSTCTGEDLNRSAYWVPAMLDGNGDALIPSEIIIYYKNHNFWESQELVQPFPDDLRMVSGRADATSPQTDTTGEQALPIISFSCGPAYQWQNPQPLIPDCSGGNALEMNIAFPACYNPEAGTHRPDETHVSHPAGGYYQPGCPNSHPYDLSSVMYRIFYLPKDYGGALNGLHLSSDVSPNATLPGGTTSHGDWYGAWHPKTMEMWVENCNNTRHDCEIGLLQRNPDISLKPHKRGFYQSGYRAQSEDLIKLCPGKEIDPKSSLATAYCRHTEHSN